MNIADRLYDYPDEEMAADAVVAFQVASRLGDEAVLAISADEKDLRRADIEKRIFEALGANWLCDASAGKRTNGSHARNPTAPHSLETFAKALRAERVPRQEAAS